MDTEGSCTAVPGASAGGSGGTRTDMVAAVAGRFPQVDFLARTCDEELKSWIDQAHALPGGVHSWDGTMAGIEPINA